jgi:hypothetical protein
MSKMDNLNKWLDLFDKFAPIVFATLPADKAAKIAPVAETVVQTMRDVAQIAVPGADKKATVLAALASGVATANAAGAHLDANELASIASPAIDTTILIVKAAHDLHAGMVVPVPVPPITPTA